MKGCTYRRHMSKRLQTLKFRGSGRYDQGRRRKVERQKEQFDLARVVGKFGIH